jgi:hypothetical protein
MRGVDDRKPGTHPTQAKRNEYETEVGHGYVTNETQKNTDIGSSSARALDVRPSGGLPGAIQTVRRPKV